jgi:hypothetical protein
MDAFLIRSLTGESLHDNCSRAVPLCYYLA